MQCCIKKDKKFYWPRKPLLSPTGFGRKCGSFPGLLDQRVGETVRKWEKGETVQDREREAMTADSYFILPGRCSFWTIAPQVDDHGVTSWCETVCDPGLTSDMAWEKSHTFILSRLLLMGDWTAWTSHAVTTAVHWGCCCPKWAMKNEPGSKKHEEKVTAIAAFLCLSQKNGYFFVVKVIKLIMADALLMH